jgi:hypothetical protein
MTVAELIEKILALPDKTARVVKSPGPYVDKDLEFPVEATDPGAIHIVYL